jgi:LysM repeat protein
LFPTGICTTFTAQKREKTSADSDNYGFAGHSERTRNFGVRTRFDTFALALFYVLKKMKKVVALVFVCISVCGFAQNTKEAYIAKFKNLAIDQMKSMGVPASIILAQACLESNYGRSKLATLGKNHFGVKCHKSWTGEKIYFDDDAENECFRKYKTDEDSFNDHSVFLRYNRRYASLFELSQGDYKGWAQGLRKAGYATNPRYTEQLIMVIENHKLYLYDKNVKVEVASPIQLERIELENFVIQLGRTIYTRNGVNYVIAMQGDSFEEIASEFKLTKGQLLKYNDLNKKSPLVAGMELYIKPKKTSSSPNFPIHIVQHGETMFDISQKYAVKLSKLYDYNKMDEDKEPDAGQEIFMR